MIIYRHIYGPRMNLFHQFKAVRVTNSEQLDRALAPNGADQVIVEGDDELLATAVSKASKASSERHDNPEVSQSGRANMVYKRKHLILTIASAGIVFLIGVGFLYRQTGLFGTRDSLQRHLELPSEHVLPEGGGVEDTLHALAWPAVAIVAIISLYFVVRQAISGGRNVEISWKVTEKVSGRVVITKVGTRANRRSVTT